MKLPLYFALSRVMDSSNSAFRSRRTIRSFTLSSSSPSSRQRPRGADFAPLPAVSALEAPTSQKKDYVNFRGGSGRGSSKRLYSALAATDEGEGQERQGRQEHQVGQVGVSERMTQRRPSARAAGVRGVRVRGHRGLNVSKARASPDMGRTARTARRRAPDLRRTWWQVRPARAPRARASPTISASITR